MPSRTAQSKTVMAVPALAACLLLGWWWGAADVAVLVMVGTKLMGTFDS